MSMVYVEDYDERIERLKNTEKKQLLTSELLKKSKSVVKKISIYHFSKRSHHGLTVLVNVPVNKCSILSNLIGVTTLTLTKPKILHRNPTTKLCAIQKKTYFFIRKIFSCYIMLSLLWCKR